MIYGLFVNNFWYGFSYDISVDDDYIVICWQLTYWFVWFRFRWLPNLILPEVLDFLLDNIFLVKKGETESTSLAFSSSSNNQGMLRDVRRSTEVFIWCQWSWNSIHVVLLHPWWDWTSELQCIPLLWPNTRSGYVSESIYIVSRPLWRRLSFWCVVLSTYIYK